MRIKWILMAAVVAATACRPTFNAASFATTDALYTAAMAEYNGRRWENAVKAFERLTAELPQRDPRVPAAYFYLAKSQEKKGDDLLAAKSFARIHELTPQDTLADDGLFASGFAYQRLWRKPALDAAYGDDALTQYQSLRALYPDSPLLPRVAAQLVQLDEWFAMKDYETGYHYLRRKAYDSAIIYFKDVIRLYPAARKTRDAYLRLHEAYSAISYKDDLKELCAAMHKAYPQDREVRGACGAAVPAVPAVATQ